MTFFKFRSNLNSETTNGAKSEPGFISEKLSLFYGAFFTLGSKLCSLKNCFYFI